MGTHYLVDAYTATLGDSPITDVRFSPAASTSAMNGSFVIKVDESLDVRPEEVSTLNDLLTAKYTELLASFPGFSTIVYDDMLDYSGVDQPNSQGVVLGHRGTNALAPWDATLSNEPLLRTSMIALGSTPTQALVTWELFAVSLSDDKDSRESRFYTEIDPNSAFFSMSVSFNNWATQTAVSDGALLNIPVPDQGNQLVLGATLSSALTSKLYIGSWAVIF